MLTLIAWFDQASEPVKILVMVLAPLVMTWLIGASTIISEKANIDTLDPRPERRWWHDLLYPLIPGCGILIGVVLFIAILGFVLSLFGG